MLFVFCYFQTKFVRFTDKNSFQTADALNLGYNQKVQWIPFLRTTTMKYFTLLFVTTRELCSLYLLCMAIFVIITDPSVPP